MGCAKRLHNNGKKFKLITPEIGGRVKTSPDGEVNYGAYYTTADCKTIMPYLRITGRVKFSNSHLHDGNKHYHLFSFNVLKHTFAGLKLIADLYQFRRHVLKLRRDSFNNSREELVDADPLLKNYYHQKAGDYIKDRGLEPLVKEYLEQFLWASFFVDPRKVSTAFFLGSLQPLIVPSYSFKMLFNKMIKGFQNSIIIDTVVRVKRKGRGFELKTKYGKIYRCKKLVLATQMKVTNQLVKPQKINGGVNVSYYHINGNIKKLYDVKGYNFFSVREADAISHEQDGTYLYFYNGKDNIKKYFKNWEVITHDSWKPGLYFLGDQHVNLNPEPNLFLATDHDVPGMEDAFINGHYTAKLVLES